MLPLLIEAASGRLRQSPPRIQALRDGTWIPLRGRFRLLDATSFGFEVDGSVAGDAMRIDPEMTWSTFLGGSGADAALGAVIDANGCPILTGFTASSDFVVTQPIPSPGGDWDVFVTRLSPDASTVLDSARLGGSFGVDPDTGQLLPGNDTGSSLAVEPSGRITLIGLTGSADFPTTPGCFDPPRSLVRDRSRAARPRAGRLRPERSRRLRNIDDPLRVVSVARWAARGRSRAQ